MYFVNEALTAYFIAKNLPPLPQLGRVNGANGLRFYYDDHAFYPNNTGIIDAIINSPFLSRWKQKNGDEAEIYTKERCVYGTIGHALKAHLSVNRTISRQAIAQKITDIAFQEGMALTPELAGQWEDDQRDDMLCLSQFLVERQPEPLLIEVPLRSTTLGFASVVDELSWIQFNKQRVLAIIDYKTRRSSSFGIEKTLQLMFQEHLIRENFPQFQQDAFYHFNLAPVNWEQTPNYTLKNHAKEIGQIETQFHTLRSRYGIHESVTFLQFCMLQYGIFAGERNNPAKKIVHTVQDIVATSAETLAASFTVNTLAEVLRGGSTC